MAYTRPIVLFWVVPACPPRPSDGGNGTVVNKYNRISIHLRLHGKRKLYESLTVRATGNSVRATEITIWATEITVWATEITVWATGFSVWATEISVWATENSVWATENSVARTEEHIWAQKKSPRRGPFLVQSKYTT